MANNDLIFCRKRYPLNPVQFPTLVGQLRLYEKTVFICHTIPNLATLRLCGKGRYA